MSSHDLFQAQHVADARLRKVLDTLFPLHSDEKNVNSEQKKLFVDCNFLKKITLFNSSGDSCVKISTEPASRQSVLQLQQKLNSCLAFHQAKVYGLCPIRRAIYDQCFDELIRQVTVNCVEQGLLLFKIKTELTASLSYFKTLYDSAISFGVSKAIRMELNENSNKLKIENLESQTDLLQAKIKTLERNSQIISMNDFNKLNKLEQYYKKELSRRDEIIDQQKNIIKCLTRQNEVD